MLKGSHSFPHDFWIFWVSSKFSLQPINGNMFEPVETGATDASRLARLWIVGSKTRPRAGGSSSGIVNNIEHLFQFGEIPAICSSVFRIIIIDTKHIMFCILYIHETMHIGVYIMMILKTFEQMTVDWCRLYIYMMCLRIYIYIY